jgi:hypothetical protein
MQTTLACLTAKAIGVLALINRWRERVKNASRSPVMNLTTSDPNLNEDSYISICPQLCADQGTRCPLVVPGN